MLSSNRGSMMTRTATLPNAKVRAFLDVLISKITQWDKRYNKNNPFALAQYFEVVDRLEKRFSSFLESEDPKALQLLDARLKIDFLPDFPPAKATRRQIAQFLETGQRPSLVRRGHRHRTMKADFLDDLLLSLPPPRTPEEEKELAIIEVVREGVWEAYDALPSPGSGRRYKLESNLGGEWPAPKAMRDKMKETASRSLISQRGWRRLAKNGVRSLRDIPPQVPVEIWIETEYRRDAYGIISRWTTGCGYTKASGQRVYLAKKDMKSFWMATEIVKKYLEKLDRNPDSIVRVAARRRSARSSFDVGDLVKPSESYMRALGPTTSKKDGLVVGHEGNFILVLWNNMEEPVPVSPASLKIKIRGWKPDSPDIRRDFREFRYSPEAGGQVRRAGFHVASGVLRAEIAGALGWTVAETKSLPLQSLRGLVKPVDPELADRISRYIRSGDHIIQRDARLRWVKGPSLVP